MANTISLRSLLEKEKLNGINFLNWFQNLRIVLKQERKEYVIEEPVPDEQLLMHLELTNTSLRNTWMTWLMSDVLCLLVAVMTKGMSRQRQRVLPRQKSRLELRSRQSVFCVTGLSLSPNNYLSCFVLLAAETLFLPIPRRGDYSDPIASLIEFPSLPRPRISADVLFSADVFSAHFWVFSLGVASVQLPSLRASRHLSLATMDSELQKQHENMVAYEMIQNLKEIYEGQARQERYETSKSLFQCKMTEGTPVGAHVIKMMGYVQTLEKLGFSLKNEMAIDLILQSLPGNFKPFVLNFNSE
ncbi:hypothetical protein V6N13_109749 [Hibiscus sabdariffa]